MTLTTQRLTVRNTVSADWIYLKAIWADFSKTEFSKLDKPHVWSDEKLREIAAEWEKRGYYYAVCLDGKMIGYIRFKNTADGEFEAGYSFHSDYHGHGYAKEAMLALLDYYTENFGAKVFTAGTGLKNTPSVRFLKSCGFELTGTEKVSFYKDENGEDIYFDGGIFTKKVN